MRLEESRGKVWKNYRLVEYVDDLRDSVDAAEKEGVLLFFGNQFLLEELADGIINLRKKLSFISHAII